jgi:hypothetical protein
VDANKLALAGSMSLAFGLMAIETKYYQAPTRRFMYVIAVTTHAVSLLVSCHIWI